MEIGTYDIVMAAVLVGGAVIGYMCGILKLFRPVISLIISRYLFTYALARFTGMNEIKELVRKMVGTGIGKLVVDGKIPAEVASKLAGSRQLITAEEMFASYVASFAAFAVTYIVVRLLVGLVFSVVASPRNKLLYTLDKTGGFVVGTLLAIALLLILFMIITSMAYVGSAWAAGALQEIHETVIYHYVMKFI